MYAASKRFADNEVGGDVMGLCGCFVRRAMCVVDVVEVSVGALCENSGIVGCPVAIQVLHAMGEV